MTEYISKSAVVAEIKSLMRTTFTNFDEGVNSAAKTLLESIDTFEVKEIDLKKELDYGDYMNFFKEHPEYDNEDWGFEETWTFGQYCYKLGLKAK